MLAELFYKQISSIAFWRADPDPAGVSVRLDKIEVVRISKDNLVICHASLRQSNADMTATQGSAIWRKNHALEICVLNRARSSNLEILLQKHICGHEGRPRRSAGHGIIVDGPVWR